MKNLFTYNQELKFNEMVFEHRNRNYGAYVLRNEEGSTLKKAMLMGVGLFATIAIFPLILNNLKTETPPIHVEGPYIIKNIPPEREIVKPAPPTVVPPKQIVKTTSLQPPNPTAHPKVETPMVKQTEIAKSSIGTETHAGETPNNTYQPPIVNTVPGNVVSPTTAPVKDPNAIEKNVDIEASFNGGINAFRQKVVQNFDVSDFEGSGEMLSTTVSFVVEKDGTISNIKATGSDADFNKEAEKTIRNIKGKWFPAKLDGGLVRSYFKFPISMKFE